MIEKADVLEVALVDLINHYVRMINSGDCGSWDPEDEDVIKRARRALAFQGVRHGAE